MLRNLMLRVAANPGMVRLFSSLGRRSGLFKRFVAGETLESALQAVRELNSQGIRATLDLLGEGVRAESQARQATSAYVKLLREIARAGVRSGISIKLTQLGLDISEELTQQNLAHILENARELDRFVRIDMEGSDYTDATIRIFEESQKDFSSRRVGIVIQAYLHRSEQDVRRLSEMGCDVRLCKGAYREPPEIAFQKKADVDANFIKLMEILVQSKAYTAIASHDHRVIEHARNFIAENNISPDRYEFQMLYGVRRDYQQQLHQEGYKMRVYVPFGTEWAPYFMRRLAERPANLFFILRAIFGR